MLRKNLVLIISLVFFVGNGLIAQDYIGAAKCKMCHNKELTGQQYKLWSESAHAKAWKTLGEAKALEIGKKKGIANPQTDAKCLKCHTIGATADKTLQAEGVSCEACHGPGSAYKSPAIMKDLAAAKKSGLIVPDKKLCEKCHNPESPTYKPFDFASFSKKIAHPNPSKK
jgi:hypothetical protein